jgi:hypothetical protein
MLADKKDYKRVYVKAIAIKEEHLKKIDEIRGKKTKAGKLDEIINYYLLNKNL